MGKNIVITMCFILFFFGLFISSNYTSTSEVNSQQEIRIGTGSKSGSYYAFINDVIKATSNNKKIKIINISTNGSNDNLANIKNGSLDGAIVQNDIAYNTYYKTKDANKSFSSVVPLFPEYFQVIVKKDDTHIHNLKSLMGKRISIGKKGSGTYDNAKDILEASELTVTKIDNLSLDESLEKLKNSSIDAVFYTGAGNPKQLLNEDSGFKTISLSEVTINRLIEKYKHYNTGNLNLTNGEVIKTVSLTTYLVLDNKIKKDVAKEFISSLFKNWEKLSKNTTRYTLISEEQLPIAIQRKPVELHKVADKVLTNLGYKMNQMLVIYSLSGLIFITLLFNYISNKRRIKYDRLGNLETAKGLWRYRLTLFLQGISVFTLAVSVVAIIDFSLLKLILIYEEKHAIEEHINNPFATITIKEAMIWMWGWIGGHEGDIYPQSVVGKILVNFPPMLGVFAIGWVAFETWLGFSNRRSEKERGTFVLPLKNHVVMCGWNDKSRGIIFGLTNRHAPSRKNVVVVAEMEGNTPLNKYNFPKGYVYYYRGDSSDHRALEASHIHDADSAIILACDKKKYGKNIGSVLTTLCINKSNYKAFTVAELKYLENKNKFEICNINALIHANTIVHRLAAQSCFNSHTVSFFLDMITHDEHVEYYAMSLENIKNESLRNIFKRNVVLKNLTSWFYASNLSLKIFKQRFSKKHNRYIQTYGELKTNLLQNGIGLIAVYKKDQETKQNALIDDTFTEGNFNSFISRTDSRKLNDDDIIVYSALEKDDIFVTKQNRFKVTPESLVASIHIEPKQYNKHILLIGCIDKCTGVINQLKSHNNLTYDILTDSKISTNHSLINCITKVEDLQSNTFLDNKLSNNPTDIIILSDDQEKSEFENKNSREKDAKTLLIAKYIHTKTNGKPNIIAEMQGRNTRELFKNAGVDVVLPCNLIVERMIIKVTYGYSVVSNYLMAMLALNDKIYFDSIKLETTNDQLLHLDYKELLLSMPNNLQLLGIYPKNKNLREELKNQVNDFGRHYIASPAHGDSLNYKSEIGDILLVLNGSSQDSTH